MRNIIVIAHNIRSTYNVGSIFRTCEGFGVEKLILSGYTPYPLVKNDSRLPHITEKITRQIHKTALGAENLIAWSKESDPARLIRALHADGYTVAALEQTQNSKDISSWIAPDKIAILLGREVEGIESALLELCDYALEIPQFGHKESLNVVQAAAIALYQTQFATSE